jgi:hypothetical protein
LDLAFSLEKGPISPLVFVESKHLFVSREPLAIGKLRVFVVLVGILDGAQRGADLEAFVEALDRVPLPTLVPLDSERRVPGEPCRMGLPDLLRLLVSLLFKLEPRRVVSLLVCLVEGLRFHWFSFFSGGCAF